jgi:hypothetical protein
MLLIILTLRGWLVASLEWWDSSRPLLIEGWLVATPFQQGDLEPALPLNEVAVSHLAVRAIANHLSVRVLVATLVKQWLGDDPPTQPLP